jgi:hypothetical protein
MAPLPKTVDPTLEAVDRAIEKKARQDKVRPYLGMSAIGHPCDRRLWYSFRWSATEAFDAATLKRFEDGHYQEDVQAKRLRLVEGITLLTIDPETGRQFGYSDHGGHFKGHADGVITGLLQAPVNPEIWEHKATDEKKQDKLEKLKTDLGEKAALKAWDTTYYAQAQLYMHYSGLKRHYLTCSSPGGRKTVSCRTEYDSEEAGRLIARAQRIVSADYPLTKLSDDPSFYMCRWCCYDGICHGQAFAKRNCRTCLHSSPIDGGWLCGRFDHRLTIEDQREGCQWHRFIPELVPGEQIDAADTAEWVTYRLADGSEWRDE